MDPTILLIDDDPALLEALPVFIRSRLNADIDCASSVTDALRRAAHQDYEVILSDLKMPGADGLGFVTKLRAVRPITPIVLMSGCADDIVADALSAGVHAFVAKPIDRHELIQVLTNALQARRETQRLARQHSKVSQ